MGSLSDYTENLLCNTFLGTTINSPNAVAPTVYIALFTTTPGDAGGGTEVTGGAYARKSVTNDTTNFPNAVAGSKSNAIAQTFTTATADWGTIVAYGLYDAATAGNLLCWSAMAQNKIVYNGDPARFPIGSLVFSFD